MSVFSRRPRKRISRAELERRVNACEVSVQELWKAHNDHDGRIVLEESFTRAAMRVLFPSGPMAPDDPPPDQEVIPGLGHPWPGEAENDTRIR